MTNTTDPVPHWTRQLAQLRAEALKRVCAGDAPDRDITDQALEACDGLLRDLAGARLECDRLRAEVQESEAAWEHLFDVMPGACLLTNEAGRILHANRAAGALLNLSSKHLKDRDLVVFSEDRSAFGALLRNFAEGGNQFRATMTFRPRERRPAAMQVLVIPMVGRPGLWLWFLTPATSVEAATPRESSRENVAAAS